MPRVDWHRISAEIGLALHQWERKQVSDAAVSGSKKTKQVVKG